MNKNILKLLAALTMVIDHAGLLLFPQVAVLRWIGRISFPLFAFCVGDGCVYTRKPRAYLLRVLGLGIACQAAFAAEELLGGGTLRGSQALYLNILFTLSLAILLCTAFLRLQRRPSARNAALFAAAVLAVAGADVLCQAVTARTGVLVTFDYGAMGAFLPLFAVVSREKHQRFALFSLGMALYCLTPVQQYALRVVVAAGAAHPVGLRRPAGPPRLEMGVLRILPRPFGPPVPHQRDHIKKNRPGGSFLFALSVLAALGHLSQRERQGCRKSLSLRASPQTGVAIRSQNT